MLLRFYAWTAAKHWPVQFYPGEGSECPYAPMLWVQWRGGWWVLAFRDRWPWQWGTFRV